MQRAIRTPLRGDYLIFVKITAAGPMGALLTKVHWEGLMKMRRLIALVAVSVATLGLASGVATSAASTPPVLGSPVPFSSIAGASAFTYSLSGALNQKPSLPVNCVAGATGTGQAKGTTITIPGIGIIYTPTDSCYTSVANKAEGSGAGFAGANLLGGLISVGAADSVCFTDNQGDPGVGSSITTISINNGAPQAVGNSPLAIVIPGVASVFTNLNSEVTNPITGVTTFTSIGVEVQVLPHTTYLLGIIPITTAAQTIILGECSISGTLA